MDGRDALINRRGNGVSLTTQVYFLTFIGFFLSSLIYYFTTLLFLVRILVLYYIFHILYLE